MKSGPIIIIEDDVDDQNLMQDILRDLGIQNELKSFTRTAEAFTYLKDTSQQPFVIFSDMNLPQQSGIEFKRQIDEDTELRRKSIPFIFYTTSANQSVVNEAYTEMTVQGFFQKEDTYERTKELIRLILEYWKVCRHPNTE